MSLARRLRRGSQWKNKSRYNKSDKLGGRKQYVQTIIVKKAASNTAEQITKTIIHGR